MTRFEPNLRTPGPTMLPSPVRAAGARQMINHRSAEFAETLDRIEGGMRPYFSTSGDIVVLSCSGTGGLEAAVVNTLSPGDRVFSVSIGAFGDRFASIAELYGASVDRLSVEWGSAAIPETIEERLRANGPYRAVLLTHNETSTGVTNPLSKLVDAVRGAMPDVLVLVDGISSVGAMPFEMDEWGVDVAVSGSQKSWMSSPGLAMVAASDRGWEAMASARMPRFYLDLQRHRDAATDGETPWTPALSVYYQVEEGVRLMNEEGRDGVFARHRACAAATRAGLGALGFQLFADPTHASTTVTSVRIPEWVDWPVVNAELKRKGVTLAGGQSMLKGKIFRVGHLGSVTVDEILGVINALEMELARADSTVEVGRAVAAAAAAAYKSQ